MQRTRPDKGPLPGLQPEFRGPGKHSLDVLAVDRLKTAGMDVCTGKSDYECGYCRIRLRESFKVFGSSAATTPEQHVLIVNRM